MKRNTSILIVTLALLLCLFLLASSPALLDRPMIKKPFVPWGTPIAWATLILFPGLFWLVAKRLGLMPIQSWAARLFFLLVGVALLIGLSWGIVSYLLADNWSFDFTDDEERYEWWGRYSTLPILLPLVAVAVVALRRLVLAVRERVQ